MSTRKQLAALLAVSIGGLILLALVSVCVLTFIRKDIARLSEETTPLQIRLAKLQRGFERVNAGFARISSASSVDEGEAIEKETAAALDEIQRTAAELTQSGQPAAAGSLQQVKNIHERLRQTALQRVESRRRLAAVYQDVAKDIESVGRVTTSLAHAIDDLQHTSQEFLQKSKKTALDANTTIKTILGVREKVLQLGILLIEVRTIDSRFRLNVLRDRQSGVLESLETGKMTNREVAESIDQFAKKFSEGYQGKGGLLDLRAAVLQAPGDDKAKAAFDQKQKALNDSVEALSTRIMALIDPLELATTQANLAMSQATTQIGQAGVIAAAASEVNARERTMQSLAWQLQLANSEADVGRIGAQISAECERADVLLKDLETNLGP